MEIKGLGLCVKWKRLKQTNKQTKNKKKTKRKTPPKKGMLNPLFSAGFLFLNKFCGVNIWSFSFLFSAYLAFYPDFTLFSLF